MSSPPPPPPPDTVTVDEFKAILQKMLARDEVMVLAKELGHVAFHIAAQTSPLRALGKQYVPLSKEADELLRDLNGALRRQDFSLVPNRGAIGPIKSSPNNRIVSS